MSFKSPLRYPGGKTRAIKVLDEYMPSGKSVLLSPFLGGASFELHCAGKGMEVFGNDLFVPLYTFWSVLKENPTELQRRVQELCPVTKETFTNFRKNILTMTDPIDIATAYYIVNRSSFSGATFCGGFSQQSAAGRMNQSAVDRLTQVSLDRVHLSNDDCITFLNKNPETDKTFLYADPPYYISTYVYGKDGDMHERFNHEAFAQEIKKRSDWLLSYNDCPYIRQLYSDCRIEKVAWSYGMSIKPSSEVLIRPPLKDSDTASGNA
jgi:DNA adenine methylase